MEANPMAKGKKRLNSGQPISGKQIIHFGSEQHKIMGGYSQLVFKNRYLYRCIEAHINIMAHNKVLGCRVHFSEATDFVTMSDKSFD